MMELSKDLLDELKCTQCEKYLTCGPIYIRNTSGEAICGRCTTVAAANENSEPVTRNKQYEIIAKKILFPCMHAQNGCTVKIHFTESKYNSHELDCKYRSRICPVSKSGECEWIGPWTNLIAHCQQRHPNNVLTSPSTLKYDITMDSLNAFVMSAFGHLFMLHVKVCVQSAKIYHSLRFVGDASQATNYKFKLDVQRDEILLSKPWKVAPEGVLTIQIDSALALCVNSLLGFLGEYEGTTFTITVLKNNAPAIAAPAILPTVKLEMAKTTSTSSGSLVECPQEPPTTQTQQQQQQQQDMPTGMIECKRKSNGCQYKELEKKCPVHERYYCPYLSSCFLCRKQIKTGLIQQHYTEAHTVIMHQMAKKFRICQASKTQEYCLLATTNFGVLICWYTLNETHFEIDVVTPLSSDQLKKHRCMIHITHPANESQKVYFLQRSSHSNSDWTIKLGKAKVPSQNDTFDIVVLLTQV